MDVILTTHNLFCKYRDAFNKSNISSRGSAGQGTTNQNIGGIWDLIIKISGVRTKKFGMCAYSYEAQNTQDETVLKGCASSPAGIAYGAVQEALVVAAMQAKDLDTTRFFFLSSNKRLVQLFNMKYNPRWEEKTVFVDTKSLQQQGLVFKFLFVSKLVLNNVCFLANLATSILVHYS